jgi:cytochrome c'
MKTKSVIAGVVALPLVFLGCAGERQSAGASAPPPASTPRMNLLQVMRAFPFPHSNVVFDTQGKDPEGLEKATSMAFSVYRYNDSDVYAGWAGVETSALALAEIAPILLTPRLCSNGQPAPVEREDWKQAVQGLVAAGEAAQKAARTKNLDAMVEASGTLAGACAACHDIYRDVDLVGGQRCSVPKS